ncbi:MAG: serine/threonine protein kinase [Myxococcales bacterium]|nr:serine/threonine protein kinase [Myxococcales bacterium]
MAKEPLNKRLTGDKKRRFPRPFGRYILEKSLSRGGMGEVYLAIVKQLQKRCVIKTIRGDLTGEEEFVGRFADEAKILVRAAHANIIRYFDAGKVAADYYIAMEHVHGRDLGDVLDRAYERGEPMPPDIGLFITQNLLEGLDYAHQMKDELGRPMGLVHRDISPQNVMIGFDGSIKLIDFGLARTDVLPNRTQGALAVGKYGYMSPEQARHESLDGRADIYSTGVMLFEVFTGDRLVDERDQATLWQRVLHPKHRNPRSVLPTLSADIDRLVMRAVAVKPRERFSSARAMADYVSQLRGPNSSKKDLLDYLRYLYPHLDFSAPPLPPLDDLAEGVRQSVIFATSREGARSVFGRGELPIEGTMHINAADVRREIEKNEDILLEAESPIPQRAITRPNTKTERGPLYTTAEEATSTTKHLDLDATSDKEHLHYRFQPNNPSSSTHSDNRPTEASQDLFGSAGPAKHREDEQTIMMHGPPRALYTTPQHRVALVFGEEHKSSRPLPGLGLETLGSTEVEAPSSTTDPALLRTEISDQPPKSGSHFTAQPSDSVNEIPSAPHLNTKTPLTPTAHRTPLRDAYRPTPALPPLKRESSDELSPLVIIGLVTLVVSVMVIVFMLISE